MNTINNPTALWQEAVVNFRQSQFKKAKQAIAPLLNHPAADAETFFLAGLIEGQLGNWQNAEHHFNQSLQKNPSHIDTLLSLGNAQHMLGKMEGAISSFRKVLALDKSNADAWNYLGAVNEDIGRFRDAYDCYENTLSSNPGNELALRSRASVLGRLRWMDQACDAYDELLVRFPQNDAIVIDYAEFLEQANRVEKASDLLEQLKNIDNKKVFARSELLRCKILSRKGDMQAALTCVRNARKKTGENYLGFREGNILDRLGQYDEAIATFKIANQYRAKQRNFQRLLKQPVKSYLEHKINLPIMMDDGTKNAPHRKIVFITGLPRSGTTLIDRMLDAHPEIQVFEELEGLRMTETVIAEGGSAEQARATYWEFVARYVDINPNKVIIDKNPINVLYLDMIPKVFPHAKVILVLRHPYDAALSCFMQDFDAGPVTAQFLDLKSTGEICARFLQIMYQFEQSMPQMTHRLHYEALVEDFQTEVRTLLKSIDMQWHDNIDNYAEVARNANPIMTASYEQVTKSIYKNAVDRWRNYDKYIKPLRSRLGEKLPYFSYSD